MATENPRLSIGLPVYNGENFIAQTLSTILSQNFKNFEIIISDNASTDSTEKICRDYMTKDSRIRYYRNSQNLGMAANFNRTYELSRGEYFQWISHDDLLDPSYCEKCIKVLDDDSSVVLCHSQAQIINQDGQVILDDRYSLKTSSEKVWQRFGDLICASHHEHRALEQFGIIRSNVLRESALMGYYAHADRILLAQLSLQGRFFQVSEKLFFYRNHCVQSIKGASQSVSRGGRSLFKFSGPQPATEIWDPTKKGKIDFPEWRVFSKYLELIHKNQLYWHEKTICYLQLSRRLIIQKNWARLIRDLLMASESLWLQKNFM